MPDSRLSDGELVKAIDRIIQLFEERGADRYGGEEVTQTEHALQAALAAEKDDAPPTMIAAALMHDLGHLLHNLPEDCADQGVDDEHENLAVRWLERFFGPEVTEPIRLHVAAKRYLCATKPGYHEELSEASKTSLRIQGGPFSAMEVEDFEAHPFSREAVQLRIWDDVAKVKNLPTPNIEHYRPILEQSAKTT